MSILLVVSMLTIICNHRGKMNIQTAKGQMTRARTGLILDQPFFASLLLRLKVVEDSSCETIATDGRKLSYNPKFVEGLSLDELKGVLAHEVLHLSNLHQVRRGSRDHGDFNRAADYAINGLIEDAGLKLPADRLRDPAFDGKGAEEIYRIIHQQPQQSQNEPEQPQQGQGQGQGQQGQGQPDDDSQGEPDSEGEGQDGNGKPQDSGDPGKCGEVRDATNEEGGKASEADRSQQEAEWKIAVAQAASIAKARGKLPGSLARFVDSVMEPKVDWREVLRRFVTNNAKADYSWKTPNRRFVHQGIYLPSLHSETLKPIVVAVDTSGSINDEILKQFSAELTAIVGELPISTVKVVYCDAEVNRVEDFTKDDLPLKLKACGGGGTDFRPVFEHIETECEEAPACAVYLTDMDGTFPEEDPGYPVLWASIGYTSDAPFGEVVKL